MEHFKVFIEAQSLLKKISEHEFKIQEHQKRIQFVERNRELRQEKKDRDSEELKSFGLEIANFEKELFSKEKDLDRAQENLHRATSENQVSALEKEIEKLSPAIEFLQETILEKLEKCEEIQGEIEKAQTFLEGSLSTLNELKAEVLADVQEEEKEISNYTQRVELLLNSLDSNNKQSFLETKKNSKDGQVIAFLNNRKCSRCRFEASSSQVAEIENARNLEFCQSCSRILIPATINS